MKSIVRSLMVAGFVAATVGMPQVANAEEFVSRYTYYVNGVSAPRTQVMSATVAAPGACGTSAVLEAPAVINNGLNLNSCGQVVGTTTLPAVVDQNNPIMIRHEEEKIPHLFHLGLWPLLDFSIF